MSNRPFMQFYVSDFVGDTLALSGEQVGAYILLLTALWNAGGTLPDDEVKLARIARQSVKKWRVIGLDVMAFFVVADGEVTHKRLSEELQKVEVKSKKRSAAGKAGAAAKSLKNNRQTSANAEPLLKHSPEPDKQEIANAIFKKKPETKTNRSVRLSADWVLPEEWRQDAVKAGLPPQQIDAEAERMRDWSLSSPAGTKLDWRAAWRNWCKSAAERQPMARGSQRREPSIAERAFALAAEMERADGRKNPDDHADWQAAFRLPAP